MPEHLYTKALSGHLRRKRDRVVSELRRGHFVLVRDSKGQSGFIRAAEFADFELDMPASAHLSAPVLCLTARLVSSLGRDVSDGVSCFSLPARAFTPQQQLSLIGGEQKRLDSSVQLLAETAGSLPDLGCRLLKAAKLLPAALLVRLAYSGTQDLDRLIHNHDIAVIDGYEITEMTRPSEPELLISGRAHLPLAHAPQSEIVMFREPGGVEEHFAVIVGEAETSTSPLVRLHSQCVTGDILGSLKCDCGDQLASALRMMNEAGGGILVYLQQEGRDIGLLNKVRAYALQDDGMDTVDANHRLGFETDERVFAPAASMLKTLGQTKIKLLTNNPEKLDQLAKFGITISDRVALEVTPNPHNKTYLETKKARTGHMITDEN